MQSARYDGILSGALRALEPVATHAILSDEYGAHDLREAYVFLLAAYFHAESGSFGEADQDALRAVAHLRRVPNPACRALVLI